MSEELWTDNFIYMLTHCIQNLVKRTDY